MIIMVQMVFITMDHRENIDQNGHYMIIIYHYYNLLLLSILLNLCESIFATFFTGG